MESAQPTSWWKAGIVELFCIFLAEKNLLSLLCNLKFFGLRLRLAVGIAGQLYCNQFSIRCN